MIFEYIYFVDFSSLWFILYICEIRPCIPVYSSEQSFIFSSSSEKKTKLPKVYIYIYSIILLCCADIISVHSAASFITSQPQFFILHPGFYNSIPQPTIFQGAIYLIILLYTSYTYIYLHVVPAYILYVYTGLILEVYSFAT